MDTNFFALFKDYNITSNSLVVELNTSIFQTKISFHEKNSLHWLQTCEISGKNIKGSVSVSL